MEFLLRKGFEKRFVMRPAAFANPSPFFQRGLMVTLVGLSLATGTIFACSAWAEHIILQSTTSTQNSGLYDAILPRFEAETGIAVRVVAVGTGQAIRNARNGDGDVLLVHSKPDEEAFVAAGWGLERIDVMYNDFVIVGPVGDEAGIRGRSDAAAALATLAWSRTPFVSRGDDSGTHKKELSLWRAAKLDPQAESGTWYREAGAGMGATLNIAVGMAAYTLTDRGTWLSFRNKQGFAVLVEGDPRLFNQYGVIVVNPAKHPHVKIDLARRFVDWLTRSSGQAAIAGYTLGGRHLFFPNAPEKR